VLPITTDWLNYKWCFWFIKFYHHCFICHCCLLFGLFWCCHSSNTAAKTPPTHGCHCSLCHNSCNAATSCHDAVAIDPASLFCCSFLSLLTISLTWCCCHQPCVNVAMVTRDLVVKMPNDPSILYYSTATYKYVCASLTLHLHAPHETNIPSILQSVGPYSE